MKYVIILGSVMSGIGKGITASSIGVVLKSWGLRVTAIKIDPYLNLDSGTMSPFEHGECYVLDDGGETDLDLGNYERFLDLNLSRDHNITTGKIYSQVIQAERAGKYLGKTVQVIPHVTDAIQEWIERIAKQSNIDNTSNDICIVELGGTIGDIESDPYVEALRQLGYRLGRDNVFYVNVCYCPVIGVSNEVKTKPAQNGISEIRRRGINPDLLMVRCERELVDQGSIDKLSNVCQLNRNQIIINSNVDNIYQIPLNFRENKIIDIIASQLKLNIVNEDKTYIETWKSIAHQLSRNDLQEVQIGVVGKYTGLTDSYLSLSHAIRDAGSASESSIRTKIKFIDAATLEGLSDEEVANHLKTYSHLLIPGGFGLRGIEGMILAAKYARVNKVPCLGICLGFQIMIIEYSRNVLGLINANSTEFDQLTKYPVITIMDQDQPLLGGTMRLGLHTTRLAKGSKVQQLYNKEEINERHRHRYEVNPTYLHHFNLTNHNADQLWFSGISVDGQRMEVCESYGNNTKFYIGVQFHPEYLTRPGKPHPLFSSWLRTKATEGSTEQV
jgi:CTP synthase